MTTHNKIAKRYLFAKCATRRAAKFCVKTQLNQQIKSLSTTIRTTILFHFISSFRFCTDVLRNSAGGVPVISLKHGTHYGPNCVNYYEKVQFVLFSFHLVNYLKSIHMNLKLSWNTCFFHILIQ